MWSFLLAKGGKVKPVITLIAPRLDENQYFEIGGGLIGPATLDGKMRGDPITFDSTLSDLQESKGIFHENNVKHTKLSGNFTYHPLLNGMRPDPDEWNPNAIIVPVKTAWYNPQTRRVPLGLITDGGCAQSGSKDQAFHTAWRLRGKDPISLEVFSLWYFPNQPTLITNATRDRYDVVGPQLGEESYWTANYGGQINLNGWNGMDAGTDLRKPMSYRKIMDLFSTMNIPPYQSTPSQGICQRRESASKASLSPSSIREKIDAIVPLLFGDTDNLGNLLPEKDYGELAMKASESVNVNSVNMLAFLKDLRHPMELVPKLKKLLSIKGASNNFLTVNYGWLPTISDVHTIVRAFKARKAYLDRNGFESYTAGSTTRTDIGSLHYQVEQRIKLAIDEEDNEFHALLQRLESMGTLPTLENLWDLVPYSFVVDWLVDVGGLLERIDARMRLTRLNIRYATMSRKLTIDGFMPARVDAPFVGTVNLVEYHRWVTDHCPLPPLSLQSTFQDFNHWLESGALIAQRTAR